jgi:hypothetical protein
MRTTPRLTVAWWLLVAGAAQSCGADPPGNTFSSGGGPSGGAGGAQGRFDAGAGGSTAPIITVGRDAAPGTIALEDGQVCGGDVFTGEAIPFDMFIMLDQSTSMTAELAPGLSRWRAVTDAIVEFLHSSDALKLRVGIQYFGLPGTGLGSTSCEAADYAVPAVEIGEVADPAVVDALTSSIRAHRPSSTTPTGPAVKGALVHARAWAKAHPERPTIVVLATDGFPSVCEPTDSTTIAQTDVAPALADSPKVRTFVIGAAKEDLSSLSSISRAGGTGDAVLVADSADSAKQIADAFVRISHTDLACNYVLAPRDGGVVDPDFVNVRFTAPGKEPTLLRLVQPSMCSAAGGFYYDDPRAPTKVYLCSATCDAQTVGRVEIILGCKQPASVTN